ncbi:MAG: RidA family protein [Chloroflexota bacterium]
MPKTTIQSESVPVPTTPYSQAIRSGDLLFLAGQVAVDRAGALVGKGDATAQTRQVMENIKSLVEAAGGTLDDVVKITLFVTDMAILPQLLEVRKQYLRPPYPASTAVQVVALANPDFLVEIEATAMLGSSSR